MAGCSRCASRCRCTARTRSARRATRGWIRSASRSRTSTASAAGAPRTPARRSTRPARCPMAPRSRGRRACAIAAHQVSRRLRADRDREDAHLRARPRCRVLRLPGGAIDRARRGARRLPYLLLDSRRRQEHAVSYAEGAGIMTSLTHALPRRTFLRGLGATLALPLLDSMAPRMSAAGASAPPVRLASATCRTASSARATRVRGRSCGRRSPPARTSSSARR